MLRALVAVLSLAVYGSLGWALLRRPDAVDFSKWPPDRIARRFWMAWLVFLFTLSPLAYLAFDMTVWTTAMQQALAGDPFEHRYVYLPIYAQVLGALLLPFSLAGAGTQLTFLYIVRAPIFASYLYSAKWMAEMVPRDALTAPLAIVLAPVTIFYIFFGTNHLVMFGCLLAALQMIRLHRWFWAGVLAGLGCYKFLLIPTVFVLTVIVATAGGVKRGMLFVAGGLASLLPSLVYYYYHPEFLVRTLRNAGAIGAHSHKIAPFQPFYRIRDFGGFGSWYLDNRVWLYLAIAGAILSAIPYVRGRLNVLQSLGLSAGVVALVSLEPLRLEPTIGVLWMDAVERRDSRSQIAILLVLFTHAAAWLGAAHPRILTTHQVVRYLDMNGAVVGAAVVYLLFVTIRSGSREGLFSDIGRSVQR